MIEGLINLFDRDLRKLAEEIKLYPDENSLWIIKGEIKNCGGNLCFHLIGNLNYTIGTVLGKTGYVRNRDEEFSRKNIPSSELISDVEKIISLIPLVLKNISEADLDANFPIKLAAGQMSTRNFLLHLYGHLNYHLGQINYHRRLIAHA